MNEFAKTGNVTYLDMLDEKQQVLVQKCAVCILQTDEGNKKALNVLKHFNIDQHGRRRDIKDSGRKKGEDRFAKMSIALTGARAGDILVGASKATTGAVIHIFGEDVPPEQSHLDSIRFYTDLWDRFLIKLGAIPFFSRMEISTREMWLDINCVKNENSIGGEGSRIELVQPGASDFATRIEEHDLDRLMKGNENEADGYWSHSEIENMIPRKTGSNARRHTLILIRSFWKLSTDYECARIFVGLTLCPIDASICVGMNEREGFEIFVLGGVTKNFQEKLSRGQKKWDRKDTQKIGIMVKSSRARFEDIDILVNDILETDMQMIRHAYRGFTCASYKSLLQKIIRFRPTRVELRDGIVVSAEQALLGCLAILATHPGSFVPDIQRYVTGLESMTKRVAVTVFEDSYLSDGEASLFSIISGSLLAQRVRSWRPDEELLKSWFRTALQAWEELVAVEVDYKGEVNKKPYLLDADNKLLENSSAILDELRSFPSDLGLARGWARDDPDLELTMANDTPEVMALAHCVDQHWAPGVVHYFEPEFIKAVSIGHSIGQPFKQLFGVIWDKSSSLNPRRAPLELEQEAIVEIRKAQNRFLQALQDDHTERETTGESFEMEYILDDSWIAGLVGPIEITLSKMPVMIVTLSSDDPLQLVAIRRPSRNMKDEKIDPKVEEAAILAAKKRLTLGLPLNKAHVPHPSLADHRVFLVEGDDAHYVVQKGRGCERVTWEDARNLKIRLPVHPRLVDRSVENALAHSGCGVEEDAEDSLDMLVYTTERDVIRRALVYMSTFGSDIEMNRISRDGGGTYHSVLLEDAAAYQFMLEISLIYPAALSPKKNGPSRFTVPIGPLLWTIRERISKRISNITLGRDGWDQVPFRDESRTLWPHQIEMVEEMVARHVDGGKGHFLWVTVGLGKTSAVLSFLQYLYKEGKLPKYIIYTLPSSAIRSIVREIERFSIPVNVIIPLTNIKKQASAFSDLDVLVSKVPDPVPYAINLIEHDHLRKCEETLLRVSPEVFLIVDEVHKTLNDTKRTSVALELAHLSHDFVVLTGTAVIDSNTYKLMNWLKQVVPYEVNTKNFWVAANSMIAKKVNTGVKVETLDIVASMSHDEEERYRKLVPAALGGENSNPVWSDWNEATNICYTASNREIVRVTKTLLDEGRGVMVVTKDSAHQKLLAGMIREGTNLREDDIFLLTGNASIFLTDESVQKKEVRDYKVVITTVRKAEGYTLTRLSAMVSSVYPSNNALRIQMEGRINRICQKNEKILYRTVHCGILTSILRNHMKAKNLTQALEGLAKQVSM
jgi:hypothetical protein